MQSGSRFILSRGSRCSLRGRDGASLVSLRLVSTRFGLGNPAELYRVLAPRCQAPAMVALVAICGISSQVQVADRSGVGVWKIRGIRGGPAFALHHADHPVHGTKGGVSGEAVAR
jgi:hypothetical protein